MSELSVMFIAIVFLFVTPVDIVIAVHLITAVVSSELRSQRGEEPDWFRTVLWCTIWITVTVVAIVVVAIVSTL